MTDIDLDRLEQLAEEASPGPWSAWTTASVSSSWFGKSGIAGLPILSADRCPAFAPADAAFIAAARSALPALIVELRTARVELARTVNTFDPLVVAVEFALSRFCDPHTLDTDPAAVRLKELCEVALIPFRPK